MTEELALEQRIGDRATVHATRDKQDLLNFLRSP
jgi:hypothetical protein